MCNLYLSYSWRWEKQEKGVSERRDWEDDCGAFLYLFMFMHTGNPFMYYWSTFWKWMTDDAGWSTITTPSLSYPRKRWPLHSRSALGSSPCCSRSSRYVSSYLNQPSWGVSTSLGMFGGFLMCFLTQDFRMIWTTWFVGRKGDWDWVFASWKPDRSSTPQLLPWGSHHRCLCLCLSTLYYARERQ